MKFFMCLFALVSIMGLAPVQAVEVPPTFTQKQKEEIHSEIKNYLFNNPGIIEELLREAARHKEAKRGAKLKGLIAAHRDELFVKSDSPMLGGAEPSVTIVAFMEPYCGYCRKLHGIFMQFLKTNPNVQIVFKDFPLFGGSSVEAVEELIASSLQGRYKVYSEALLASDAETRETRLELARKAGLDIKRLRSDINSDRVASLLKQHQRQAELMSIRGTPFFFVVSADLSKIEIVEGYVDAAGLGAIVRDVSS